MIKKHKKVRFWNSKWILKTKYGIQNYFLVLDKTIDVKPDPLALLSLEKEGIDVSFLKAFDPSQEIKDDISVDQIMEQLRRVFELIPSLA